MEVWHIDTTFYSASKTKKWFNFYNSQFIHDLDKDGNNDILFAKGGDIWVAPHNPNWVKGRIVIISSKAGKLLAEADMHDDCEIYMSVSVNFNKTEQVKSKIIFGTGGETIRGNLNVGNIDMVLRNKFSEASLLEESLCKGFISPPVWGDLIEDGIGEVLLSVDCHIVNNSRNKEFYTTLYAIDFTQNEALTHYRRTSWAQCFFYTVDRRHG